jgi:hypothetical protein
MAIETPPWALNGESTDADVPRHALQGILGGAVGAFAGGVGATRNAAHGVCGLFDLLVSQSSTPGMSVRVAAGIAFITGTASAMQGPYSFYNGAAVDDLAISVGDATNPRRDLVCAQVRDNEYDASGATEARLFVVEGTPAAVPVDPTPPAGCLALARVQVDANESTSILNADITDLRVFGGYEAINQQIGMVHLATVVGSGTSFTLMNNIPQIYRHLMIVGHVNHNNGSAAGTTRDVGFTLNNDSSAGYDSALFTSGVGAVNTENGTNGRITRVSATTSPFQAWIPNYTGGVAKSLLSQWTVLSTTAANIAQGTVAARSPVTAALTRIDLTLINGSGDLFGAATIISLYGLR